MTEQVLAAAKRLWPELDIERVNLIRTERAHVEFLAYGSGWQRELYYPYTRRFPFVRMTPVMTTEGYALAWSPEENVLVWRDSADAVTTILAS